MRCTSFEPHKVFLIGILMLTTSVIAGCSLSTIGSSPQIEYYLLDSPQIIYTSSDSPSPTNLIISEVSAPKYINSQKIIFSNELFTRSFYKHAAWIEPPPARFTSLLLQELERRNSFQRVARNTLVSEADFVLTCEILEFFHLALNAPGNVRGKLRCEIVDLNKKFTLTSQRFEREIALKTYDAQGAVSGFNELVSILLNEIADWTGTSLAKSK